MTIIQPHKKTGTKYFFILLFLAVLLGSLIYIYEYNKLVDLRFEVKNTEKSIIKYQTSNAELKNKLYKILDPTHLQSLASQEGLIIERHPKYVTKN